MRYNREINKVGRRNETCRHQNLRYVVSQVFGGKSFFLMAYRNYRWKIIASFFSSVLLDWKLMFVKLRYSNWISTLQKNNGKSGVWFGSNVINLVRLLVSAVSGVSHGQCPAKEMWYSSSEYHENTQVQIFWINCPLEILCFITWRKVTFLF